MMKYNHKKYQMNTWNKDLTLREAFERSCVWYFRQMIDIVGQERTKAELEKLKYGNCDVSEWNGNELNSMKDLNGFWLGSSLKISPMEQVQVLTKIFEGKSQFSKEQIAILQKIMLFNQNKTYNIYGKTGTGQKKGWYAGYAENKEDKLYFAVYLENNQQASGATAKKIAISMLEKEK